MWSERTRMQPLKAPTPKPWPGPRKTRKPIESVTMVTNTDEATAGSAPARSSASGTSTPAVPAMTMLVSIAAAMTMPNDALPSTKVTATPISTAIVSPLSKRHAHFAEDRAPAVRFGQLVGRDRAHRHGQRLGPGIAADPGDDRHQHGKHRQPLDAAFEHVDDRRGDQGGDQIGDQPADPRAIAFGDRLVDVAFLAGAGQQQHVLAGFFLDDVDDVVDRDHADQPARAVDHRGRDQGIFLEACSATSSWSMSTGIRVCSSIITSDTRADRGERRIDDNLHVPTG